MIMMMSKGQTHPAAGRFIITTTRIHYHYNHIRPRWNGEFLPKESWTARLWHCLDFCLSAGGPVRGAGSGKQGESVTSC